jgi:hypothetical protein
VQNPGTTGPEFTTEQSPERQAEKITRSALPSSRFPLAQFPTFVKSGQLPAKDLV